MESRTLTPRLRAALALLCALFLCRLPLSAQSLPDALPEPAAEAAPTACERAAVLVEEFREKVGIPGLSLAVGRGGEVVCAHAVGVADRETKEPLTTESIFSLGSTSKTLSSVALGTLVEAGKLELDAPIRRYVPYFPEKEQEKARPITPRLLAGHLGGVRNYDFEAGEYDNTEHFESVREAVGLFADDALVSEPGTEYLYSVYGFVLLSAAIEGAAGEDFLTYVRTAVLDPLEMKRTGPDRVSEEESAGPEPKAGPLAEPISGRVTDYAPGLFGVVVKAPFTDRSNKWAAGGFASTPTDMVRFGNALLAGKLLKPETFALLTTPQTLADGSLTGEIYALGWRSETRALPGLEWQVRAVHHGGLGNGSTSFFVLFPDEDLVISMQGNLLIRPPGPFILAVYEVAGVFLGEEGDTARAEQAGEEER